MAPCAGLAETFVINSAYPSPMSPPRQDGYLDLLLKEAFGRLGHEVRIQTLPAKRSLQDAHEGLADGDVGRVSAIGQLYPELVMVQEPVLPELRFLAFVSATGPSVETWCDLAGLNVGYVRGWEVFDQGLRRFPLCRPRSVVAVDTCKALFTMLGKQRLDVALSAEFEGLTMAALLGLKDVRVAGPPLECRAMYLYLHRSKAWLAPLLAETLVAMQADGTIQRLRQPLDALCKGLQ